MKEELVFLLKVRRDALVDFIKKEESSPEVDPYEISHAANEIEIIIALLKSMEEK